MHYSVDSFVDVHEFARLAKKSGAHGMLFLEKSESHHGGMVIGDSTIGFEPTTAFHALLQTSLGTVYWHRNVDKQADVERVEAVLHSIGQFFSVIQVGSVRLDKESGTTSLTFLDE